MHHNVTQRLREFVAIPSVNPAYGDDPAVCGEANFAACLAGHLAPLGFDCQEIEIVSGRPNLLAEGGCSDPRRSLLVEGHLDTVSVRGMSIDPFAGEVKAGRLFGRGACDMKGAWAAFVSALSPERIAGLASAGVKLIVVGAMGEETGNEGAQALVNRGLIRADQAIVLEPTGLKTVYAHKGIAWFQIRLIGRSGHGSAPAGGVSAIDGAAAAIPVLRERLGRGGASVPGLGPATLNVGRIHGGEGVNMIAGECTIDIDCRILPDDDPTQVAARFEQGLAGLVSEGRLVGFNIEAKKSCPPYVSTLSSSLMDQLAEACRQASVSPQSEGTGWYSDAGPLSRVCRETVVFGPGAIEQAHTADEWISLDELCTAANIFGAFLDALINRRSD